MRKEQIKRLYEYKWHILFLIREEENQKQEKNNTKQKEKQKVLVLNKNFYGKDLKVGIESN